MVRKNVDPLEIIRAIKETLESFCLDKDNRFNISILEEEGMLKFKLNVK